MNINKLIKNTPLKLSSQNPHHLQSFRTIIEMAWSQFRWNGFFAKLS